MSSRDETRRKKETLVGQTKRDKCRAEGRAREKAFLKD